LDDELIFPAAPSTSAHTHFMFNKLFPKIMQFIRCGKIWQTQPRHKWQYNTVHALGIPDN
jgi:hypothetical protein